MAFKHQVNTNFLFEAGNHKLFMLHVVRFLLENISQMPHFEILCFIIRKGGIGKTWSKEKIMGMNITS